MTKATSLEDFVELTSELHSEAHQQKLIPQAGEMVPITIWKLSPQLLQDGHRSTAGTVVREVCSAMRRLLLCCFIKPGNTQRWWMTFYKKWFSNCLVTINGTKALAYPLPLPTSNPPYKAKNFINQERDLPMVQEGLIDDHPGRVVNNNVGWSGKPCNAGVCWFPGTSKGMFAFQSSMEFGFLLSSSVAQLMLCFLGFWTVSLYAWAREECFNITLSSCRMSLEWTFGRLKGRWQCVIAQLGASHH